MKSVVNYNKKKKILNSNLVKILMNFKPEDINIYIYIYMCVCVCVCKNYCHLTRYVCVHFLYTRQKLYSNLI